MIKQTKSPIFLAFLFPLFGLAVWTGILLIKKAGATTIEVAIIGYDPRDLFSGHYIQYSLDLGTIKTCTTDDQLPQCICLNKTKAASQKASDLSVASWAGPCSDKPEDCQMFITGQCQSRRLITGLERFYIPAEDAQFLTSLPPKSTLMVQITGTGEALAKELKPEGQIYKEWIQKMRANLKEKKEENNGK